jgi:magnesium chelatase subunit I
MTDRPRTLRELRDSGCQSVDVKTEMRRNLLRKLRGGENLFPGILGYDETVIPQVTNAVLSRHDMLFLGLRGQGKTRMLRMLTNLLDDVLPIVAGSEINDDPFAPISKYARDLATEKGDDCPIEWVGRDRRYHEKLATPDVTIADLIGEVDLIKHAEGRHLASEDVMHFGLIPRSHRGIFCMNELPDLSPKIQVGLFNVLEERDVQIRGFTVRLNLDLCLVFSANPEDYTNRGRIVTPLKDRIGSVVRTHYPQSRQLGIEITDANAWQERDGIPVDVPGFMKSVVEEISRLARTSPHVNHASGVSVRMSIANYENMLSNAERRAVLHGEERAVARISDLAYIAASTRGKMELAMSEETGEEDHLVARLVDEAVKTVFDERFDTKQFRDVVTQFESGKSLEIGDSASTADYLQQIESFRPLAKQAERIAAELEPGLNTGPTAGPLRVAVAEFLLDGLHANNRLNKRAKAGKTAYGI